MNVENISDILISFSEKHNLWSLTKKSALESINNCIEKEKVNKTNELNGLTAENFILVQKKQELIFWAYENNAFIIRTTYNLYTDKQKNQNIPFGDYSLDVDKEGKIVDDWLIFH
jgi:hypothetical protein